VRGAAFCTYLSISGKIDNTKYTQGYAFKTFISSLILQLFLSASGSKLPCQEESRFLKKKIMYAYVTNNPIIARNKGMYHLCTNKHVTKTGTTT